MQGESRKQFLLKQLQQLENAHRPYEGQWRELCDFILPNCGSFSGDPPNQVKRNSKILDPTGWLASRALESRMLTGITSPTRPWFSLSTLDKNLMSRWTVKVWLKQVQERMNEVLNRSNFYQTVPVLYRYLGTIGTSAILILEDEESVIRTHV